MKALLYQGERGSPGALGPPGIQGPPGQPGKDGVAGNGRAQRHDVTEQYIDIHGKLS